MANHKIRVSDQYPELFHYTNVPAFENIYKTKQFWPTQYTDLNDSSECNRFRLKVREFIRPKILEIFDRKVLDNAEIATDITSRGGINKVVDVEADQLLDFIHSRTFDKHMYKYTFITSFCAHKKDSYEATHGLLSQWRGYGADGGIAIVLDTTGIESMMEDDYKFYAYQLLFMGDVIYDSADNNARIKADFTTVFDCFPEMLKVFYSVHEPYNEEIFGECIEQLHDHFVLGSTLVKHHAFHEENEIRIVVSPTTEFTEVGCQ